MKKVFCGAWATFDSLEETSAAFTDLKASGFKDLTVHSPIPLTRGEIFFSQSKNPIAGLGFIGGFLGTALATGFIIWSSLDWILPVSGKPLISIPLLIPVVFEVCLLSAIVFIVLGLFVSFAFHLFKQPLPNSTKYLQYNRFSRDRFGLVVPCQKEETKTVQTVFRQHQAREIEIEG